MPRMCGYCRPNSMAGQRNGRLSGVTVIASVMGRFISRHRSMARNRAARFKIFKRNRLNLVPGAERRIRVAGGATQIARVDDFDEREAGGEFFERRIGTARGISSQRPGG